ncbi:class I SAM-dependent methyltransferase [Solibaculum mannosilyticum]|uniref:Methyltransferase type 11 domain-containing protein n=1 Tax=Solibaculum mannosilyticum TaxID=2780922 RepID=A0A7I8D5L0_9FIRM|nr:class I SAM-dependent methyltransferase [Solibaculum mannosilyticum]BCI60749.1 hypothetical protein C12CBH8_13880 [Solibaculum mannosilyticum]
MRREDIDGGKRFDWNRAAADYAKYRDIYPPAFYEKIVALGLCVRGQKVLDVGTGTGILPRNLAQYGADFVGIDLSAGQIEQAKRLSKEAGLNIPFRCVPAEEMPFPDASFNVVTACQCFMYFDHKTLALNIYRVLKPSGRLAVFYMAWLPLEDNVAGQSEALILKHNPAWTGCQEMRHPIAIPEYYLPFFEVEETRVFDVKVPFTRESWNGRIKACRGVEASLSEEEVKQFDQEHRALLQDIAPPSFQVLHYTAIAVLRVKK